MFCATFTNKLCARNGSSSSNSSLQQQCTQQQFAITTITISTATAKPNIVPVFVVVAAAAFFFASNYKHIRLTQMHNKMSLDLRQKTEIKPAVREREGERETSTKRNNNKSPATCGALLKCVRKTYSYGFLVAQRGSPR